MCVRPIVLPCLLAGFLGGSASLIQAGEYRIAVVDPNRIVEQSPQYEAAREALQREIEERERSLREQQEQVAALQRQLERDGSLMSESELQRLQNDIRSRTRKIKYARDEFQDDFALRQSELRTRLSRQVQEVVVELAKEQQIDLILSDGLVYANPRIDISDLVIERLRQEFEKHGGQRAEGAR
ncbi:OmpH family outer membrane protein [Caldichromatium japonicum]|uniref:OmpH family outer membrane protein n=1 Tax=Caldichromatium japonicum TaxID=2699430 RepID=A0A6G7VB54_9GAMM|nr:OmpH family outer membrane protein [Caldichromatium japonicum]QIK37303.1 OmpH family outer membrane protein [Caldichromatium japonicum]